MKRIIEGATYNTDTATLVAEGAYEDEQRGVTSNTSLYQNKAGVFFTVEAAATKTCEQLGLTILRDFGDLPPEAEAGEASATVYVRAPPSLKAALEARAAHEKVSLNVLMLRCAEECLGKAATNA